MGGQAPGVACGGEVPHWHIHRNTVVYRIALIAGLLLGGAVLAVVHMLWRRARTLAAAAMDAACMPARDGLVVMEDEAPDAYALPGLPGRIVVSTGMLHTLHETEHDILLAHERAHLAAHHYAFVAPAQLGAAANPLLRPLATAVTYTIERWADESAATSTGDRTRVARTVGKAALAAHRAPAFARATGAALGILGRRGRLAGAGPVPDRIDDAVHHLLRAGRDDDAAELMLRNAETWFFPRGAAATYLQFGERLPIRAVAPALAFSLAYTAALCGDQEWVNRWLDVCEASGTPDIVVPGWHNFRSAVLCVRAGFGMSDAEAARSVAMVQQALREETEAGAAGHPTVRAALGAMLARDGRFDEAATLLLHLWSSPTHRKAWPPSLMLQGAGTLTISLVEAGRGEDCDRVLREARPLADAVERDGRETSTPGLAPLRIAQARRSYQNADMEAATALLPRAVALAELHPRPTVLFLGLLYLADAELACGDRPAARAALTRAREVVDEEPMSGYARRRLEESEARLGRAGARTAVRSGALPEELTDRGLSILRALQGSATQREIGAAMFLSINTVKAYNKSLYRKLGVASRYDAVTTARELGLI